MRKLFFLCALATLREKLKDADERTIRRMRGIPDNVELNEADLIRMRNVTEEEVRTLTYQMNDILAIGTMTSILQGLRLNEAENPITSQTSPLAIYHYAHDIRPHLFD